MGRVLAFLGLLIALAIGGYLFTQHSQGPDGAGSPRSTLDVVGVKNDLVSLANAERRYFARESKYASIDELRSAGDTNVGSQRGPYMYNAEVGDNSFRITAIYTGPPDPTAIRSFSIDENMEVH